MKPRVQYDENGSKPADNGKSMQHWAADDDSEDDSDYTPDVQDCSDAESDDDYSSQSPKTPVETATVVPKRKSSDVDEEDDEEAIFEDPAAAVKKQKIMTADEDAEAKRKARVEAIWAEMNKKDEPKRTVQDTSKQPLDDISSTLNNQPSDKSSKPTLTTAGASTNSKSTTTTDAPATVKTTTRPATTTRRPGIVRPKPTLSALVSQYNIKVPKMNTLEKSRLDWHGYVEKEGIRDELKYKNKDGYMEKVAFLQRVDDRRLSHLKAGQKASRR